MTPPSAGPGWHNSVARSVARNTLFLSIADIISKLLMMAFFMVGARVLGVERFGILTGAIAFVSMFSVLTDLGLGQLTARELAKGTLDGRSLVGTALSVKLVTTTLAIGAVCVTASLAGYPGQTVMAVFICSMSLVDSGVTLFFRQVSQGLERTWIAAAGRLLQVVLLGAGLALAVRMRFGMAGFAWLYAGAGFASAVFVSIVGSRVLVRPRLNFQLQRWRSLLRQALPFAAAALLIALYYWSGSALLLRLRGDTESGLFGAPFRLVIGMTFPASAFSGAMYPVLSRAYALDSTRVGLLLEQAVRYVVLMVVPLVLLVWVLAEPLMGGLFGTEFVPSAVVLRVLMIWTFFAYLNALLSHYLQAVDRPSAVVKQAGISLAVCVVLNLVLIPLLSSQGAALALCAAEGAGFVALVVLQRQTPGRLSPVRFLRLALKLVVAGALTAGVAMLVAPVNVLLAAGVGAATYVTVILALRALGGHDLALLLSVLPGRRP